VTQATTIVQRALFLIGAHSKINPAPPETITEGVEILNEMLAEWLEEKVNLGAVEATSHTTDIEEPAGTMSTIRYCLAVEIGDALSIEVPPTVETKAIIKYESLKRRYEAEDEPYIPDAELSRLLPLGQGSTRGSKARTFFRGKPASDETPNT
jgi:hypothetical protein